MMKVYTLRNCDTCKKALKWLASQGIAFDNHDIRSDGLERETIASIVNAVGWEIALNRRSTMWRGLSDDEKTDLDNERAIALIEAHSTLMKRPVFVDDTHVLCGFDAKTQAALQ